MFIETRSFACDTEQDLDSSTWTMPNGQVVLVCQSKRGFTLYTPSEWNNATVASHQTDGEGHILVHGRPVDYGNPAWVVPEEVRERAI